MDVDEKRIKEIYSGMSTRHYDLPISHFFGKYKKLAFKESPLHKGDSVLVFCCGTGLDFPPILEKIGENGKIVGIDFSAEMLEVAEKKIIKNKWANIELISADVTKLSVPFTEKFDLGICTLGISIIPDYLTAYRNLVGNVKKQGHIIIGDMQLASGWLSRFNPFTIYLAKRYGGSYAGHQNSTELSNVMRNELSGFIKREFFFKSYFYCIGRIP